MIELISPTTLFLWIPQHPAPTTHEIVRTLRKEKKQHGGAGGKGKWDDLDDGSSE